MSLALYRRYRPETFAELIGQDHVTTPLRQALRSDRVSHAYLFSGPRGCGKTTSARILARCLNCEQGPTDTPCGTCQSCQDLARGGPGSLDVIEIDAASHGGVDDARDLRERAFFAPASSRYKIYIVDEAHMVSTQGFNALLKLVEEPPEHVKFVFATTEPDKVIGTIRSRTHHYPFRLVPPAELLAYLEKLCADENVKVEPSVLPLVVRAGEGSVRDTLSVLDQLIAGADEGGVSYSTAVGLLGYTDAALLGSVVDALAAHDGASAFAAVDRVIEGGLDPRRFVADLLERFRDLILIAAVPDAAAQGLVTYPADELEAMSAQAASFGKAELVRNAEVLSAGLTEMRGATAPRLQLELLVARLLLPGADDSALGVAARIDTVERRLAIGGAAPVAAVPAPPSVSSAPVAPAPVSSMPAPATPESPSSVPAAPGSPAAPASAPEAAAVAVPAMAATPPAAPSPSPGGVDVVEVRRMWPTVLEEVRRTKRVTWMLLFEKTTVLSVSDGVLSLAFDHAGSAKGFTAGGHDEILRQALSSTLGVDWRVEAVVDPGRASAPTPASAPAAAAATPPSAPPSAPPPNPGSSSLGTPNPGSPNPGSSNPGSPSAARGSGATDTASSGSSATSSGGGSAAPTATRVVEPAAPNGSRSAPPSAPPSTPRVAPEHDEASSDDVAAPDAGVSAEELVARQLGGTKIGEIEAG